MVLGFRVRLRGYTGSTSLLLLPPPTELDAGRPQRVVRVVVRVPIPYRVRGRG